MVEPLRVAARIAEPAPVTGGDIEQAVGAEGEATTVVLVRGRVVDCQHRALVAEVGHSVGGDGLVHRGGGPVDVEPFVARIERETEQAAVALGLGVVAQVEQLLAGRRVEHPAVACAGDG